MSRTRAILVTGAGGEIGHSLIQHLTDQNPAAQIVALDLSPLPPELERRCSEVVRGNILDKEVLSRLAVRYDLSTIWHLAALLSTRGEFDPALAHSVNVNGTVELLELAATSAKSSGHPVQFFFPSSIAVYGIADWATRNANAPVREEEHLVPQTMYGCNKLYCEHLGRYYAAHYRRLAVDCEPGLIDFRSIRFPGLMSAFTMPSGGTSDYGPEMIHHAAKGQEYNCFVPKETRLPFMAMPDAVRAMLELMAAPRESLTSLVYNISGFHPTAEDFARLTQEAYPGASIRFQVDERRFAIVASWPAMVDDSRARRDWGFAPEFDLERAFADYLLPEIRKRYA